jgi:hypothetical protein
LMIFPPYAAAERIALLKGRESSMCSLTTSPPPLLSSCAS